MDRRKIVFIVIIIIIILIVLQPIYSHYFFTLREDEFDITYDYQTRDEHTAIKICEDLSYSDIFNISRYDERFVLHPNYIDTQVISKFRREYNRTKDDNYARFDYTVRVKSLTNASINYAFEHRSRENIYLISVDGNEFSKFRKDSDESNDPLINHNISGSNTYWDNKDDLSLTNFNGYIVEMSLSYGITCGGLCGHGFDNNQVVILDNNYEPYSVFLFERSAWES